MDHEGTDQVYFRRESSAGIMDHSGMDQAYFRRESFAGYLWIMNVWTKRGNPSTGMDQNYLRRKPSSGIFVTQSSEFGLKSNM